MKPRNRLSRLLATAALGVGLFLGAAPAGAQSDPAAQALFDAGRKLVLEEKFEAAIPKFEESYRLLPMPGTSMNLANCYAHVHRTASAWAQYKDAAFLARKAGQSEREDAAVKAVAALEAKLSRLRIDAEATPGLVIRRDGQELGAGALGVSLAIDPGKHAVEATAPGYAVWSTEVTVGEERDQRVVLVPKLQKPVVAQPAQPSPAAAPAPSKTAASHDTQRLVGFTVGGVGVASAVVGSVLGLLAVRAASSAKSDPTLCPADQCTTAGRSAIDAASTKALIATVGVSVGAAAVATGVVLVLLSGSSKKDASATPGPTASLVPSFGYSGGGLSIVGAF